MTELYDLAVIGGGINGIGIARDAAGRGLSVYVCEKDDLASGTSSRSTKLIHGGLRYLEHYEFRLVREALNEREVLLRNAPHIIWPLRFVLPHMPDMRPSWMIRAGLFLYDNLGKRTTLPASTRIDLRTHATGQPLNYTDPRAYVYSDCWVEDARMVLLNAQDARARGARIDTRTELVDADRADDRWTLQVREVAGKAARSIEARMVVNAAGPWVNATLSGRLHETPKKAVRLVQGSHIVVPSLFDHDFAYIFQNPDGRIFFAIPYEKDFTLIGTTDNDYQGDPEDVHATDEEITYICKSASAYFKQPIEPDSVVWTYSGVRPLFADAGEGASAQKVSRDYHLETLGEGGAPLLSVYGGKITTFRRLAEDATDIVTGTIAAGDGGRFGGAWTDDAPLPGGDVPNADFAAFLGTVRERLAWLEPAQAERLARYYGTRIDEVVGNARSLDDLGRHFGADLYEREVVHAIESEWVRSAEDLVWRRSKLGLRMTAEQIAALDDWIAAYIAGEPARRRASA